MFHASDFTLIYTSIQELFHFKYMSQSFRKSLLYVIFDVLENQMTLKLLNTNHKSLLFIKFYKLWLFFCSDI